MAQTIKLKRGTTTPTNTDIVSGEVAIDTSAKKLYINDGGTIKEIGGGSSATSGAGAPSSTPSAVGDIYIDTTNDVAYIATDTVSSSDWKVFIDPALQSIVDAGTSTGADQFLVSTGASTVAWESASTARGSMGLGTLATLSSVSNTNWSGTDLSIANGGTGQSTAVNAAHALLDNISLTAATVATDDKVLIQDTDGTNVLKTVTAQSIADLAVSGWNLLGSIDSQNTLQTSLAFATDAMGADYDDFLVTFEEAYRTDSASSASLQIQFATTAGWLTGNSYKYGYRPWDSTTFIPSSSVSAIDFGHPLVGSIGNASTKNTGWFKILGAKNNAVITKVIGQMFGDPSGSAPYDFTGAYVSAASIITNVRFLSSLGDIAIRAKLYGMKNT